MTNTVAWTSLKLIQWTAGYFEKKGIPNPRLDAELLLCHVLQCKRIDLYVQHERTVGEKHLSEFRALIERRALREPLQYIIGETEFWGLKIKVTPDILIPRPETELLVEEALRVLNARGSKLAEAPAGIGREPIGEPANLELRASSILDIGTGSGCIAIALAKSLPEARITATDISKEALKIAGKNAEANDVADRIEFILSDIAPWKSFEAAGKSFDMIVSNPPYIATDKIDTLQTEVSRFEPRQALDGGADGLDCIRKILNEAHPSLRTGASLILEIGEYEAAWFKERTFPSLKLIEIRKDYQEILRIAVLKKE